MGVSSNIQGEDIAADFNMRAVGFAVNSEMLNSKSDTDFVNVNNAKGVNQTNIESIFERFTKLDAILNGFNAGGTAAGINITGNAATATSATNVTGTVAIANGGTGATTAAAARTNLGLGTLATMSPTGTADNTTYLRGDGTWQTVSGGGAVSSVAGKTGAVTLTNSDISGLGVLATKSTSGTADITTFLRGDGAWTALGGAAALDVGTTGETVAAGNDSRLTGAVQNVGSDNITNIVSISAGLDSNKPGTPVAGQMFVATDVQKIYRYDGSAWVTVAQVGGSSNIASVGLSLPSIFAVTNSPLTADGTISATLQSQNQSYVLAAPNAANGTPTFRQLQISDISNAKSASLYDVPVTGDAGMSQVVKGDDSRLVDARTPIDGSVTTAKIAASAVTDAKIDTVSGSKITGTVPTGTLPIAGSGVAGIVSAIAQSFSGLKTFLNGLAVTGNISASGNITGADLASTGNISAGGTIAATGDVNATGAVNADRIKVANSSAACDGTTEGSLRYNSTNKKMEYCNGTAWTNISSGVLASLSIGSPSTSLVKSGPVTFDVTYGSGVDTATINLTGKVSLGGTATASCSVTGITGAGSTRAVTVNGCSGTGTVNISVAANTAKSTTGEDAPSAGPSLSYNVDNTGPNAPTGVTLGSVPANLTNSPTITYAAASDVGGSTVASHQVQIIRTSDSSVIRAWANHTSGSDVGSLSLATNTQYSVLVRAVDALGNNGTPSTAVNWTSINDPCLGSPTPGTVCTGGAIYLGSLSWGSSSVSSGPADKYMTTPGGCSDIPAGSVSGGSGTSSYANADFTPASCSGTDALVKTWNDGTGNWYDIPNLTNYTSTGGDNKYGSQNAVEIVAITAAGSGGYHAAARYCDKLVYGGYNDWYLPNRYELNLMWTNQASIPGLNKTGSWYWSSTEYSYINSWVQRFTDGNQNYFYKFSNYLVRCVRRF
jgi:hypothetical protein